MLVKGYTLASSLDKLIVHTLTSYTPKILLFTRDLTCSLNSAITMPRLDMATRRRVIYLRSSGYSVVQIRKRLSDENISVSSQTLFALIKKHRETGKLLDLTRRARPKKLTQEMMEMLNAALLNNDELTARQARDLLTERWPEIQVSLPTIKRVRRKELGWVCTRPHYCQLLREVSYIV